MIDIMDKNGRIIRISAAFYIPTEHGPINASLSAEETVAEMLRKLPAGELIREPLIKRGE